MKRCEASPLPGGAARARELLAGSEAGTSADLARGQRAAVDLARGMQHAIVLYAGTNASLGGGTPNIDEQLGMRPSMGWPGEKLQPGLEALEELEVLTARAVARAMRARYAEIRAPSATIANLAAYAALTPVGATIAALPDWAGGHASHHEHGVPGIRGHRVVPLPYDSEQFDVDVEALPGFLERERPVLLVVGGSLALFPHRLETIAALAANAGALVLYDASHTAGLIAGGRFQDPLAEGAVAVTFSTYKSFGGPPGGVIVADRPRIATAVSDAVYPALTANYDAGRLPRLHTAATVLLRDGVQYADSCVACAVALSDALLAAGFELVGEVRGVTQSHHLAIAVGGHAEALDATRTLADAGILLSPTPAPSPAGPVWALRIATQEVVRRGLTVEDMPRIADLLEAVLRKGRSPAAVRDSAWRLA